MLLILISWHSPLVCINDNYKKEMKRSKARNSISCSRHVMADARTGMSPVRKAY